MNISFQYPFLLWLLILLPIVLAIYFYALYKKRKVFKKLGDATLIKVLTENYNPTAYFKKFLLLFFSIGLLILCIANIRSNTGSQQINKNGIDVMIALDVSKSMLAQDVKPSRLDRAKQLLYTIIDKLNNDRIGIIVFAGKAYLQMPLTADHAAAKMYLSAATPATIPTQGTVIADALASCNASFNPTEKKYKSIILISDGEDHDENAIKLAEEISNNGVVINTVGIGSPQGSQIINEATGEPQKDRDGNVVVTKLNEQMLQDIATKGNGVYALYSNTATTSNDILQKLSTLDKRNIKDESLINYYSWFQFLMGFALFFLIVELFISENKKIKPVKKIAATFAILLIFTNTIAAQSENRLIKKGNEAYSKNDYQTAIKNYETVLERKGNNSIANFNLANALYKSDKKEEAKLAYEKATSLLTNNIEKSNALYNKAVVLQNEKKQTECIEAYKNALKLDPTNTDARHNLQLALQQQKQQNKDKKDNKNSKKDKQKENDQQDKNKNDQQDKPKPSPSNLTKKEAEQQLQALQQKEKNLQDKLHKVSSASPNTQEKDW